MGRYARQTITDVPYHVINRGNNHQPIFFSDDDYCFILEKTFLKSKWSRRWIENLNSSRQGESLKCEPVPDY
jgi:REP element-mobilizing transposase RayT